MIQLSSNGQDFLVSFDRIQDALDCLTAGPKVTIDHPDHPELGDDPEVQDLFRDMLTTAAKRYLTERVALLAH